VFSTSIPTPGWPMAGRVPDEYREQKRTAFKAEPPLSLGDCYRLALKHSDNLAMQDIAIEKTWADFLAAAGDTIGDADFKLTHFYQEVQHGAAGDAGATSTATRSSRRSRYFTFSQPLFRGFKALAAVRAAGNLRKERTYERLRAEQLLFYDVAESFYNIVHYQKDIVITEEIVTYLDERIKELHEREAIGRSRPSEVATAMTRIKTKQADLARSRGMLSAEKRVMEFLTGVSLDHRTLIETQEPQVPSSQIETALENIEERADVKAAFLALQIAKRNITKAQSDLWPEISVDGNLYEKREGFQSGIDWDLLLTFDIPLFKGGTTMSAIKAAVSDLKTAEHTYSEAKRQAELELKQAWDLWNSSFEELKALQDAQSASEENYKLQKEDYEHNLVNNLDVLEALESFSDARLNVSRAYSEMNTNYWDFKMSSGDCCDTA